MVQGISKRVEVILAAKVEGAQKLEAFTQQLGKSFINLGAPMKNVEQIMKSSQQIMRTTAQSTFFDKWTKKLGINQQEVGKIMSTQGMKFDEFGDVTDLVGRKVKNLGDKMVDGRRKTKPFKFEFLSVMFAGMALQRTFGNLNKTAREWTGIAEIMSITMGAVMLPATMDLLEYGVIPFSDLMLNLPDPMKKVIGYLSLMGEGAGLALATMGQIGLAAMGFEKLGVGVALSKAFSSLKDGTLGAGIGKIIGNNIVRGIAGAVGAYLIVKDIFFDEEGSMELGNKIGASVAIGIAAKSSVIGAAVFAGLITVEAFQDPEAFGSFSTKIVNWLFRVIESISTVIKGMGTYIWDLLTGGFEKADKGLAENTEIQKWLEDYTDGVSQAVIELENAGKISRTLSVIAGRGVPIKNAVENYGDVAPHQKGSNSALREYAVGGSVGTTGLYKLHSGEKVISKAQNNGSTVSMNVTYNVNVSDKREFEKILRDNNNKLTQDVRRLTKT